MRLQLHMIKKNTKLKAITKKKTIFLLISAGLSSLVQ